jgi:hypothetical protein
MSWTLQHDTTTQSLADWGLSGGVLTGQNLSAGELSFAFDGDQLAAALAKTDAEIDARFALSATL